MKLLLLLCLFVSLSGFAQPGSARLGKRIKLPINYQQLAHVDFEAALKNEAALFDQARQPQADPVVFATNLLCGNWSAEALGDSWSVSPQPINKPDKRLIFKNDSLLFYRNDTLTRTAHYQVMPAAPGHFRVGQPLLKLSDTREQWVVVFYQVGDNVPWHGKATKPFLLLVKEPDCLCGCTQELYSREMVAIPCMQ